MSTKPLSQEGLGGSVRRGNFIVARAGPVAAALMRNANHQFSGTGHLNLNRPSWAEIEGAWWSRAEDP